MEVREIHNVRIMPVAKTVEFDFMFYQFSDADGHRHMLHEPVQCRVSGKMPLVMVIETLSKAGEAKYTEEAKRFAERPEIAENASQG